MYIDDFFKTSKGRPTLGTPSSHPPVRVGLITSHLLRPKLVWVCNNIEVIKL